MDNIFTKKVFTAKILLVVFFFFLWLGATPCLAVVKTTIKSGLVGPKGVALDEANNHLYFVEFTPGNLVRIDLADPAYPATIIATGLPQPTSLSLDLDRGVAYVTTDNLPGYPPKTGALWRVDLATGVPTLLTFNLGQAQQLVLNYAKTHGYTSGYLDGRLRRIDLITGAKVPIYTNLKKPVGIVVTQDEKYAYVCEQGPPRRIVQIDLTTGSFIRVVTSSFSSPPFFLAWTDTSENALYVAERGGAATRKISRVDLSTSNKYTAIQGSDLYGQPYGITVKGLGAQLYVTMTGRIVEYDLIDLSGPVFMAVGHVPSTAITTEGYADTKNSSPGYFYQVEHCPFGGTMNIFGNFTNFKASAPTAVYYAVIKTKGATSEPLSYTWKVNRWNATEHEYQPYTMAPALDGYKYEIPVEGDGLYHADLWWYPFWIMRWPSGENGTYDFKIKLYDASGIEITPLPAAFTSNNHLTLYIDNTPPVAKIDEIWQKRPGPDHLVQACEIVEVPDNDFYFRITAYDSNQHLLSYRLSALWGDNQSDPNIVSDNYSAHVAGPPTYPWSGIFKQMVLQSSPWSATCDCATTFYLRVWKRTINGYNYILHRPYHKSITINNTGAVCN